MNVGDQNCPLCSTQPDTQEHALSCHIMKEHMSQDEVSTLQQTKYEHMLGSVEEQAGLATVFLKIIDIREKLLEDQADQGLVLDQRTRDTYVWLVYWK